MPVDSVVAQERIWIEHCQKLTNLSMKNPSTNQFSINPFRLRHNKPVTDPISVRRGDFLDRHTAALQSLSSRLAQAQSSAVEAPVTPFATAKINKERAIKGNNIFGQQLNSVSARQEYLRRWSEFLNHELGGSPKRKQASTSPLPDEQNKVVLPPIFGTPKIHQEPTERDRSSVITELLLRASKPPTEKYARPVTESHELGWGLKQAWKPDPHFVYGKKSCEITRFAEATAKFKAT